LTEEEDMMPQTKKLAVIGFDSISLPFLETFVHRGVMPTVKRLMEQGSVTQTWPCYPMETATNWACLATGATPAIHGCNMAMPEPGGPLGKVVQAFPSSYCKAEQLWTAAHRAGKRSVIFDWTQSYPLTFDGGVADSIIHVGEDGRPHFAFRALQEARAYTTDVDIPEHFHVTHVRPVKIQGEMVFEVPITPTASHPSWGGSLPCRYHDVSSLVARMTKGPSGGYEQIALYASQDASAPLLTVRLGEWSDWGKHTFIADGEPVPAYVRAKLLKLSPDGRDIHLYLSEIYPAEGFTHPVQLAPALVDACGPYIIQSSRQQVVIANASDIETYFEEQHYMGEWYRRAAEYVLTHVDWDLFMFKWHGPDWTNHLTMYMIDPDHALYDPDRAEEGWAYWDKLMALGDDIVRTVVEAAAASTGDDVAIASDDVAIAGDGVTVALVSDHGGSTDYVGKHHDPVREVLKALGLLVEGPSGIDWTRTRAYSIKHNVYINTEHRFPNGNVAPHGAEYHRLKARIIEALLDAKDTEGRHAFRTVLPIEDTGHLGVDGPFAGDIFVIPSPPPKPTQEAFFALHPDPAERGTWDWPRLNSGAHSDDSYFVLTGPGVRESYCRSRPTLITSVAPTLATVLGIPIPQNANGGVLWDFFRE
jgi:predicted AlkP superfamily phosphohydrolase/phosphomutase